MNEDREIEPASSVDNETSHNESPPRLESLKEVEGLWQDKAVNSYTIRRHSDYERIPESGMRGALNREGIDLARASAKEWVSKLPNDATVSIYQSPSYQYAKTVSNPLSGETRDVLPARATITASLYEKELYGNQKPGRRMTERRLGDFFEEATSKEGVQNFFKSLGEHYGKLTPKFWKDYVQMKIHPEVNVALLDAGGHDSLQLANNVVDWLEESSSGDEEVESKKIGLGLTHGETIHSFLHHLSHYLESSDIADPETIEVFRNFDPHYNEGIDVHISDDKITVVVADKHAVAFPLDDFKKHLSENKEDA